MRLNRVLQFLKASPFLILGISTPTSVLMPPTGKFHELNHHTQALSTVLLLLLLFAHYIPSKWAFLLFLEHTGYVWSNSCLRSTLAAPLSQ